MCDPNDFWTMTGQVIVVLFIVAVFFVGLIWGIAKVAEKIE